MFRRLFNTHRKLILIIVILLVVFLLVNRKNEEKFIKSTEPKPIPLKSSAESSSTICTSPPIKNSSTKGGKFYVLSPKCKIPYVDPFSEDATYTPLIYKTCANEPDLFKVRFDTKLKRYIVHVDEKVALTYYANYTSYGCVYREISRVDEGTSLIKGAQFLTQDWIVPQHFLGVVLECRELSKAPRVLQQDAFAFIQYPLLRNETIDNQRSVTHPNVFLLGIDGMSRMNFHRTMPQTARFVRQEGWYEMEGYNKVGDNTLPNLLAVLTGRTPRQWRSVCDVRRPGCFDYIKFLWNHFSDAGYLTAYAEDLSSISTFNYLKHGFERQPVDFYIRPFLLAIEQHMKTVQHFGYKYCVGRKLSFSYVYDFALHLVQRFVQESARPLFGLFWTSSFTHDDFRGGYNLDEVFVDYLERFKELGLFENAIVILFSDHGPRYGPLAELPTGYLEERLPMLHIYAPAWYRQRYPKVARALDHNRRCLSSNYDLHLGIRQVLEHVRPQIHYMHPPHCPRCISLLRRLPKNRSCKQAGIPEHYCTCEPFMQVPSEGFLQLLTRIIVSRMNGHLRRMNYAQDCYRLRLSEVIRAERKQHFNEAGHSISPPDGYHTYRVKFSTYPKNGKFRATFMCNPATDGEALDLRVDRITRLNLYRNDSYCVDDLQSKKFCVCIRSKEKLSHGSVTETSTTFRYMRDENDYDELDD